MVSTYHTYSYVCTNLESHSIDHTVHESSCLDIAEHGNKVRSMVTYHEQTMDDFVDKSFAIRFTSKLNETFVVTQHIKWNIRRD